MLSVLKRLNSEGEVAHEEDIGGPGYHTPLI